MKFFIIVGMVSITGGLYAGHVGEYLGLSKGTAWAYKKVYKDSSWTPLETFVAIDTLKDTVKIVDEFIHKGDSAYLREETTVSDTGGSEVYTDTLLEEGDSLISMTSMDDTLITGTTLYKIPFEIGKSWHFFWNTLYIVDQDTLRIIKDLIEVVSQEDISVPFGEIKGAYKLKHTLEMEIKMPLWNATIQTKSNGFGWYKPSLGLVQDTSYEESAGYLGDTLLMKSYSWEKKELTYMTQIAGTRENRPAEPSNLFKILENPFHNELSISFSLDKPALMKAYLYNVLGREARRIDRYYPSGQHILRYKPKDLPNGVYFLRVYQNGREVGGKKVIKIE